jgi:uncharacterized RDD family membrane protein YckC
MNTDSLRYAGFWPRLASLLLDLVVMLPLAALVLLGEARYRLFSLYYFLPGILFQLFYSVYLVKQFGGTPGKLIMGIRIRKLDGQSVGYREALLRYLPDFILGLLMSMALIIPVFHMSDAEYHSFTFIERSKRMVELAPSWYKALQIVQHVWFWGELLVLLTNRKRRALHDFIAGTVVVHVSKDVLEPAPNAPIVLHGT